MSEKEATTRNQPSDRDGGLGLGKFAMSAVGAIETHEASEISSRITRLIVWLVLLGLIVAGVVWWFTSGRDLFFQPTPQDEAFLIKLRELPSARVGMIYDFEYIGRNNLKFELHASAQISGDEKQRAERQATMRQAVSELVVAFGGYRANQDVKVNGYIGEEKVAEGRLEVGATQPWIHLENEEIGPGAHISSE